MPEDAEGHIQCSSFGSQQPFWKHNDLLKSDYLCSWVDQHKERLRQHRLVIGLCHINWSLESWEEQNKTRAEHTAIKSAQNKYLPFLKP